ncbi:signal recognition particle-docking protein FtsY [Candidatus Dependentiae bacterium]|nr:signal recognition particle-docking protein FtsY [Candidatus Dependentiae bacterium]
MGLFDKLKNGLFKTRTNIISGISAALTGKKSIDSDFLEQLEEILISADVGAALACSITEKIANNVKVTKNADVNEIINCIKTELKNYIIDSVKVSLNIENKKPAIVMICGVNGVGKTTSIGKLTTYFRNNNKTVMLAACDTFRAAAIEQLEIWANRANVDCVKHQHGADVGAVVYDAISSAVSKNIDVLIVDTAGRLHTKLNLMDELKKIKRVIQQQLPTSPDEVLLVVDATTGQNAINQVQEFNKAIGLTGIILTKMDGTAKGGLVFAMIKELNIPIKFIGVGEKLDDLREFDAEVFIDALFDTKDFEK